jgi:ATP phosphoribosyltransferase
LIKIALPAGDLRRPVAELLNSAGLRIEGYGEGSRAYRLPAANREDVAARVFRERDIPIQVAMGNYDLGICNFAWVKEMGTRFPSQPVVVLGSLGIGNPTVFVACASGRFSTLADVATLPVVRIASEYANLADAFALAARIPAYRVQGVWGSAEAYPPEDADLVLISADDAAQLTSAGLTPIHSVLRGSAYLIANEESLRSKALPDVLSSLTGMLRPPAQNGLTPPKPQTNIRPRTPEIASERTGLRLAVPDGHQQRHVVQALVAAGLRFEGYDEAACVRRPKAHEEGLDVKVVRPHDMPQLVAAGQVDLAITGRDCLMEHRYRFPSSPAVELVDLQRGQYNLCAVVTEDLSADGIEDALAIWRTERPYVRIASEFAATADYYARSRHIWRYQVIPIAGASEGFVPDDAELLIEGTETGKTLKENRLKSIDLLYRSTTCLIGHASPALLGRRAELYSQLLSALSGSVGPA